MCASGAVPIGPGGPQSSYCRGSFSEGGRGGGGAEGRAPVMLVGRLARIEPKEASGAAFGATGSRMLCVRITTGRGMPFASAPRTTLAPGTSMF